MIKAKCPSCGWKDDVDDSFLGAEAECPECETVFTVKKLRKKKKKVKKTNELIVAPKEDFEKISFIIWNIDLLSVFNIFMYYKYR